MTERCYLFGYLDDDFFGRVLVTPSEQTLGRLAQQLRAWGWSPHRTTPLTIANERGDMLDPGLTIAGAGLHNGDIVHIGEVPA